ncbi:10 kDa chaperonin, mitochondrial-like isoform X4 [Magnolia sinica]|uniref:10 kDa chaperonin, mitochondrial-like isoform X4 n=1 Tax=Magnolia sinica TaxID=86752 RepID=UPI0026588244|nr:10 kDa chaperonin, mitochondrial-like isoform X4 [Magnolia sinica]
MVRRLIPSLNRILVEKIVPQSKTNAGILLPEKTNKLNSGKVVAVGPGARDRDGNVIPVAMKGGDTVLLPEYGGTEVKLGDKEFIDSAHVMAKVNEGKLQALGHLEMPPKLP